MAEIDKFGALVAALPISDEHKKSILESDTPAEAAIPAFKDYSNQVRALAAKDPDFTKPLIDEGYRQGKGKTHSVYHSQLKAAFPEVNFTFEDERGELPPKALYAQVIEQLGKAPAKGGEEFQKQLIAERAEKERLKETYETQIKEIQAGHQAEKLRADSISSLRRFLPEKEKLTLDPSDAIVLLSAHLDSSFKWGVNAETGEFNVLKKDGSIVTDPTGSKPLSPEQIIGEFLTKKKYIKESNGQTGAPGTGKPQRVNHNGNGGQSIPRKQEAEKQLRILESQGR